MNNGLKLTGGTSGSASVSSFSSTSNFTFAAWINSTSSTSNQYIGSIANNAFSLYVNSSHKLVATPPPPATFTDSTALTSGNWYLVGITYNSSTNTLTFYKNGVAVGSNTHTGTTATGATTLYIGGNKGSVSSFNGAIDEVRYYSSALNGTVTPASTLTQMRSLYNGFGPIVDLINPGSAGTKITTTTTGLVDLRHRPRQFYRHQSRHSLRS